MQEFLSWAARAAGATMVACLSVTAFSHSASAFSFTSDRDNCGPGIGCSASPVLPGLTNFAFEGASPTLGLNTLTSANLETGTTPNVAAEPFQDRTQYFVVGKGTDNVTLPATYTANFAPGNSIFGLYWGSADATNVISFYSGLNGTGTLLGSLNGDDITIPVGQAAGDQNNEIDNRYITVFTGAEYRSIVFSTNQIAFEIDNVSTAVPEPTTMIGLALAGGAGLWMKRRQKQQQNAQA